MVGRSKSRRDAGSRDRRDTDTDSSRNRSKRHDSNASCSSSKRSYEDHYDEELEAFLQSRAKCRKGSVGSRMDETGPYLPPVPDSQYRLCTISFCFDDERPRRACLGPERPSSSKRWESSDDESEEKRKRSKKTSAAGSQKRHSKKHRSKDKDKKKRKKEKRHRD